MKNTDNNHEIWRPCQNCGEETDVRKSPYCDSCGEKVKFLRACIIFIILSSAILSIHFIFWITKITNFNFWYLIVFLFLFLVTIISSYFINDSQSI